jgi:hypothetical protein
VNPQPERWIDKYVPSASPEHWLPQGVYISDPAGALGRGPIEVRSNAPPVRFPYGKPGDRLYAQESWRVGAWNEDRGEIAVDYRADGHCRREWIEIPDPDAFVRLWQQSTDDAMRAGRQTDAYGRYNWDVGDAPTRWRPGRSTCPAGPAALRSKSPRFGLSGCRRSARGTPKLRGAALDAR